MRGMGVPRILDAREVVGEAVELRRNRYSLEVHAQCLKKMLEFEKIRHKSR